MDASDAVLPFLSRSISKYFSQYASASLGLRLLSVNLLHSASQSVMYLSKSMSTDSGITASSSFGLDLNIFMRIGASISNMSIMVIIWYLRISVLSFLFMNMLFSIMFTLYLSICPVGISVNYNRRKK